MKTVIDGVLSANLPWGLVLIGAAFAVVSELLGIPSLAFAVGIYLPLSAMTPVFVGGVMRSLAERLAARDSTAEEQQTRVDQGVLFGSGLIAGEGVMGIGIAVFALILGHKPEGMSFALSGVPGSLVSLLAFASLCWLLVRSTRREA